MAGVCTCFVHFLVQTFNENFVFCTEPSPFNFISLIATFWHSCILEVRTVSQLSGPEYLIIVNDIALINK